MSEHDDELLDRLRSALEIAAAEPTASEVTALRDLVDEERLRPPPADVHAGSRRRRARRGVLAAAFAAALVVGSGAVAVATNGPFSGAARRAASALGLPVDSPELANAKDALAALQSALARRDDRQIEAASRDLARRLAEVSGDDARSISQEAHRLLHEAGERLGAGRDQGEQPGAGTGRNGDRPATDEPGSGDGGTRGPDGGHASAPSVSPSQSGSESGSGGTSTPTAPSGGSEGSGDHGGATDGGASDGGSGTDGGSH